MVSISKNMLHSSQSSKKSFKVLSVRDLISFFQFYNARFENISLYVIEIDDWHFFTNV